MNNQDNIRVNGKLARVVDMMGLDGTPGFRLRFIDSGFFGHRRYSEDDLVAFREADEQKRKPQPVTEWCCGDEVFDSQYGTISHADWLKHEAIRIGARGDQLEIITNETGQIALMRRSA